MSTNDYMDAIISRHDITEHRKGVGSSIDHNDSLRDLIRTIESLIHQPNVNEEIVFVNPGQAVSDTRIQPVEGITRTVIHRTPIPPSTFTVPTTGAIIFTANVARFGGALINTGSNPLQLVLGVDLANVQGSPMGGVGQAGYGTLWLSASGGSWNFKLTDSLWAGSVYGYAIGGSTTIAGLEI
jgi:hypothetical protein